jgi:hypothetical protein
MNGTASPTSTSTLPTYASRSRWSDEGRVSTSRSPAASCSTDSPACHDAGDPACRFDRTAAAAVAGLSAPEAQTTDLLIGAQSRDRSEVGREHHRGYQDEPRVPFQADEPGENNAEIADTLQAE